MKRHDLTAGSVVLAGALNIVVLSIVMMTTTRSQSMPLGGAWLDAKPIHNWNKIAERIPKAPAPVGDPATSGRCARTVRPPSTREDRTLEAAGWKLFRPYELYATTSLVAGMASVDGMCRPLQFNVFVFSNAQFAGTLSPVLMNSRSDGGLQETYLIDSSSIMATFSRYKDKDPLCCPSRVSTLEYALISSHAHPLVTPLQATTSPASQ